MSVNLDHKGKIPIQQGSDPSSKAKPKLNNFERWVYLMCKGYEIEMAPSSIYCLNKWKRKNPEGDTTSQACKQWREKCQKDCENYRSFTDWHRFS